MRRALAVLAACAASIALAACGGRGDEVEPLTVSAASSLKEALTACTNGADPPVRLQFAGSDELAAQIRKGVRPDVFAAANTTLPDELRKEGRLDVPVTFATNRLVMATQGVSDVETVADAARDGARVVIGSEGVPVGDYTRDVLGRLEAGDRILANVRSEEPDVKGIIGKLVQGAADAGFVYISDVKAVAGDLRPVELPKRLRPLVEYGAGVVQGTDAREEARAFVEGLPRGACADALEEAGFGAPPL